MGKKLWESVKTALIALLTVTFLLLTLMALPANIAEKLPLPQFLQTLVGIEQETVFHPYEENTASSMVVPILISVKNAEGRASIRQDNTALALAYNRFTDFFSVALSTAEHPVQGTDVRALLNNDGVLFSFAGKLPAEALCHWLGAKDGQVDGVFGQFALVCEENTVYLYAAAGGRTVKYQTAVNFNDFHARVQEYFSDGTLFASEVGITSISPFTLWLDEVSLANYTAVSPLTAELAIHLATELNFNPYGSGSYLDPATGDRVYTEQDRSLTIRADGGLVLSAKAGTLTDLAAQGDSAVEILAAAEDIIFTLCDTASVARPMLCDYEANGNITTVSFCTVLGGVPVYPYCGTVVFEGSDVVQLQTTFRLYHKTGGYSVLMPVRSAAVLAGSGAHIIPAYQLASSSLVAGWQKQ